MAFNFSIVKRIQREFRYDIKTSVFFIGTKFGVIWWDWAALLSPESKCRRVSNIRRTKSQELNASRLIL